MISKKIMIMEKLKVRDERGGRSEKKRKEKRREKRREFHPKKERVQGDGR